MDTLEWSEARLSRNDTGFAKIRQLDHPSGAIRNSNKPHQQGKYLRTTIFGNLRKRTAAKLLERQACALLRFLLRDGPGANRSQEVVQQTLACRRVVKYFAHQGRLRRFLNKVVQPLGRRFQTGQEEVVERGISRYELC